LFNFWFEHILTTFSWLDQKTYRRILAHIIKHPEQSVPFKVDYPGDGHIIRENSGATWSFVDATTMTILAQPPGTAPAPLRHTAEGLATAFRQVDPNVRERSLAAPNAPEKK
jgi:hypothetical protein